MTRIAIVGAGMAGLAAALCCARRGHRVTLAERDADSMPGSAVEAFTDWHRPGVPQARHSHKFLARSCDVLADEAPDVLDALVAGGAIRVPVNRFEAGRSRFTEFALAARRLMYEAVLRSAVLAEPGVRFVSGVTVSGVTSRRTPDGPVVTGVRLADGTELPADLVVDAGGRHARLLDAVAGSRAPAAQVHTCGFVYLTRHYRLLPGHDLPTLDRPLAMSLGYAATLAFPADNRTFSLSVTLSTNDPLRHALRRPDTWDRFVAATPHTARWARHGTAEGPVHMMSRIENRWQGLTGPDGPVAGGLVLLGDAALQTNPTYGRGVSLAFLHAQRLGRTAGAADGDPFGFVAAFDDWTAANMGVWYRTQTVADTQGLARMDAGLRGERPAPPTEPFARLMAGMELLAAQDEIVGRGLGRMAHLLITPTQLLGDRDVVQRVTAYLGAHPVLDQDIEGPARHQFEAIVVG